MLSWVMHLSRAEYPEPKLAPYDVESSPPTPQPAQPAPRIPVRARQILLILSALLALSLDLTLAIHVFATTAWTFSDIASDSWFGSVVSTVENAASLAAMSWLVVGFLAVAVWIVVWASEAWGRLGDEDEGEGDEDGDEVVDRRNIV